MMTRKRRHPAVRARRNAAVLSAAAFVGIGTGIGAHASTNPPALTGSGTTTAGGVAVPRDPATTVGGTTWYAPPVTSTGAS